MPKGTDWIWIRCVPKAPLRKWLFPAGRGNVCEADKRDRRRERLSAKLTEGIYNYSLCLLRVVKVKITLCA